MIWLHGHVVNKRRGVTATNLVSEQRERGAAGVGGEAVGEGVGPQPDVDVGRGRRALPVGHRSPDEHVVTVGQLQQPVRGLAQRVAAQRAVEAQQRVVVGRQPVRAASTSR